MDALRWIGRDERTVAGKSKAPHGMAFAIWQAAAMSQSDLFGVACALTVLGILGTAIDVSPLSRTKFPKDYLYSGAGRRASKVLSSSVLGLGLLLLLGGTLVAGALGDLARVLRHSLVPR